LKIIYVGSPPLYSKGASAIHIFKMCNAYGKLGHDVTLFLPPYNSDKDIFSFYNVSENFEIKCIFSTKNYLRQIVHGISCAIYILYNKINADILVTRNVIFAFLATLLFRIPTIYDAHHPPVNIIAKSMLKIFLQSNNLIRLSANSKGLADMYKGYGIAQHKIVVAHNGVDLDNLKYLSKSQARKITKLPERKKIVLYSGNIYKGRGIDILIDAARLISDALFIVVGGEEDDVIYYGNLLRDNKIDNFKFIGFVNQAEVFNYLLSADVLVMPYTLKMTIKSGTVASDFTSPIKLFEYMASKRVIVAAAIPSVKEILINNVNSILVDPGSKKSLSKGVRLALEDEKQSKILANRAYEDVKNYSWDERARKILHNI
jgi:glycosyltransferase involved in cell wall biosynthesis